MIPIQASRPLLNPLLLSGMSWPRENPKLCHNLAVQRLAAPYMYIRLTPQVFRRKTVTPNRSSYRLMVDV